LSGRIDQESLPPELLDGLLRAFRRWNSA
jgi:hypothetical protein